MIRDWCWLPLRPQHPTRWGRVWQGGAASVAECGNMPWVLHTVHTPPPHPELLSTGEHHGAASSPDTAHPLADTLHGKRKMETKIIFSFINCNTDDVLWGWGYCYWCPTRPNWFPYEWRKIYIFFGEGNIFIIYCSPTLMLRSNKSQVLFPVASGPSAGNGSKLEGSIFAAILSRFPHIEHWSYWLLVSVIIMVGKLSSAEQVRIIV